MPKYYVGLSVLNVFEVEADNDFDAKEKVRYMEIEDHSQEVALHHADYDITYVELIDE